MSKKPIKRKAKSGHIYEEAFAHFKKVDPILHKAGKRVLPSLKTRRAEIRREIRLFSALAESVVSQQLSVKAADTIWERLKKVCGGEVSPQSILKRTIPRLRTAGLSEAKAKTLKALAKEMQGDLKLSTLRKKTKEEAMERLTQVWGIGPWTSEMFLMFALEHSDIFSARDLGLIRSMETLYGIKKNSPLIVYEKIAEAWSPHRTLACRILWKSRDM